MSISRRNREGVYLCLTFLLTLAVLWSCIFLRKMVFALFARPSYGNRLNVGIAMLSFAETMENHHPSDTGWVMGAPEGKSYEIPDKTWIAGGIV